MRRNKTVHTKNQLNNISLMTARSQQEDIHYRTRTRALGNVRRYHTLDHTGYAKASEDDLLHVRHVVPTVDESHWLHSSQ
jgi:hypothetical protein